MDIDKAFKAYDVRGLYPEHLDEELAWRIGHAAANFLRKQVSGFDSGGKNSNAIVVGYDMRPHSPGLVEALVKGIRSTGMACINIGMCDTPMIYFAINHLHPAGGIQVTASHNAIEYNGMKISGYKAKPVAANTGLNEIKNFVKAIHVMPDSAVYGDYSEVDLWDEYRGHVHQFLSLPRPLKVVADASNGMAGKMLPELFEGVENLELTGMHYDMDNGFVHPPNPLVESNLKWTQDAVIAQGADMGICLDGDADRCMFVDEKGQIIRCDIMTTLLALDFLKTDPGSAIIYDLRSSMILPELVAAAGGKPVRERVGHSFLKKAMAENNGIFGGELSGHSYFRDNFHADSAAIVFATVCSLLARENKPLSELVAPLSVYSHSGELNFQVEDKDAKMQEVQDRFSDETTIDHLDGVTCTAEDWWCNVRPSNTEPLLRLSLEAKSPDALAEKLALLKGILGEPVDH